MWLKRLHDVGLLWLRILMGAGIAYHGYGKIFGGGLGGFAQGIASMGFPASELFAWMAALSEFIGGICIVLGFGTRIAAFFVFSTMSVAAFVHHAGDPLSVKELALTYWTMAVTLMLTGSGKWSVDEKIFPRHIIF